MSAAAVSSTIKTDLFNWDVICTTTRNDENYVHYAKAGLFQNYRQTYERYNESWFARVKVMSNANEEHKDIAPEVFIDPSEFKKRLDACTGRDAAETTARMFLIMVTENVRLLNALKVLRGMTEEKKGEMPDMYSGVSECIAFNRLKLGEHYESDFAAYNRVWEQLRFQILDPHVLIADLYKGDSQNALSPQQVKRQLENCNGSTPEEALANVFRVSYDASKKLADLYARHLKPHTVGL